ncbi:hypothetical protein ARMGADRAFT_362628 [Armillaria gallica]|uniref:Uncharacterized protein n=1 Tax=Armillaria gallica TaxID=47427 RepID=A0A2H3D3C6_ARMGA|nr:hypothetical protein ARMGADRAFT_362628 [Armillaria gallica]
MSSATLECLPDDYTSALEDLLDQQIQHNEPLVPSPEVERELELYYRACMLLSPDHFIFLECDHMADQCCNEQLKVTLLSVTHSQKILAVFLSILQGPQCTSLLLHSMVWKELVNRAFYILTCSGNDALELELELEKIIARPLSKEESRKVTTISELTNEMQEYIRDKLHHYRLSKMCHPHMAI